jgi:exonuclease III
LGRSLGSHIPLNINSLKYKLQSLNDWLLCEQLDPDLIFISETRIPITDIDFYQKHGYNLILQPRAHSAGGGIAIYYKQSLRVEQIPCVLSSCESLVINIKFQNTFSKFLFLYRPPNENVTLFLESLETFLQDCSNTSVILGDLNIDLKLEIPQLLTIY